MFVGVNKKHYFEFFQKDMIILRTLVIFIIIM